MTRYTADNDPGAAVAIISRSRKIQVQNYWWCCFVSTSHSVVTYRQPNFYDFVMNIHSLDFKRLCYAYEEISGTYFLHFSDSDPEWGRGFIWENGIYFLYENPKPQEFFYLLLYNYGRLLNELILIKKTFYTKCDCNSRNI